MIDPSIANNFLEVTGFFHCGYGQLYCGEILAVLELGL